VIGRGTRLELWLRQLASVEAVPFAFAALRIGIGATLLLQAALVAPIFLDLYGESGLIQGPLAESLADPLLPSLFSLGGVPSDGATTAFGVLYVAALVALTLGWRARIAGIVAWLLHWTLTNSGASHNYGADQLASVALFYLAWAPSARVWSLDALRGTQPRAAGIGALALLFVMRAHLCLVYLASGIEKAMGVQWRDGEAIWRSLMMPVYRQLDWGWLAGMPWLAQIIAVGTLVVEIGYCVLIWPSRTRQPWLLLTVGMHAGIAAFLGLHVFALLMIALNVALFGRLGPRRVSAEGG
jgi:hypothetical protein